MLKGMYYYTFVITLWLGLRCSGTWHHVTGCLVPDVSTYPTCLIFKGVRSNKDISIFKKLIQACCLETLDTTHPVTRRHNPEKRKPKLHRCASLKPRTKPWLPNLPSSFQSFLRFRVRITFCSYGKAVPVCVKQAQRWSRSIAPLVRKLGARLGERSRPSPHGYDIWKE